MHRGKVADALLPQIVIEQDADITIISEQYAKKTSGLWFDDESETAAIWIPSNSMVRPTITGQGNGFVWVQTDEITLVSCYLTPSDNMSEFQTKLDAIEDEIRKIEGKIIVAGDFNSRGVEWGSRTTNSRGRSILEMAARAGLTIANVGSVPTFRRHGCEGTIPDITLVSENFANKVSNWKVLEIYTASDHQYISYDLETRRATTVRKATESTRKWNVNRLNVSALIGEIDRQMARLPAEGGARQIVNRTMDIIIKGCKKAMPKITKPYGKKSAVHWWNDSIEESRRNCIRCRRILTRARRRGSAETELANYKEARKTLRNAIQNSKKAQWEELREDINRNPWGLGYKIVMKKLGMKNPVSEMDESTMQNIVTTLFPTHDTRADDRAHEDMSNLTLFTEEELKESARKLKSKKAPGPDGIPAEVLKEIANTRPEILLNMYNCCLAEGVFPEPWKEQKLVLISKGKGDPVEPSSYRPLCMLDTTGKLFERLIKPRLEEAIRMKGGLSERQHGFRPGKSTMGALKNVVDVVLASQERNHHSRPVILLATLDVKNAFNSLRWTDVLQALERNFQVPAYLMEVLRSYLRDRVLTYNTSAGMRRTRVTSGAAQGSILGPALWNVSYDDILRIEMPENTFLVGYADDIAAVIQARNTEDAERRLRQVMIRTKSWLHDHGLELATQKTELLLLTRRQIPTVVDMTVDDVTISTKKVVNYLGMRLDSKLTFSHQIQYATIKASKITSQLSRLMANVGGPLQKKRKLLMEACNSILLYGSEIWAGILKINCRAQKLLAIQRTAALRVASAYRTVSGTAVQVIAGMVPIDIHAEERMKMFILKQSNQLGSSTSVVLRDETIQKWQVRWNSEIQARWTAKLIPNIDKWINRNHGDTNYYMTQMLSGHGYFRKYLHKIGKCSTPFCLYETDLCTDDAEHTFFQCCRWTEHRNAVERQVGHITVENLTGKMIQDEDSWNAIARYCENVLRRKKTDLDNV